MIYFTDILDTHRQQSPNIPQIILISNEESLNITNNIKELQNEPTINNTETNKEMNPPLIKRKTLPKLTSKSSFPTRITDCDLQKEMIDNGKNKYLNTYKFKDGEIQELLKQRITETTKICNPNDIPNDRMPFKRLNMSQLKNNMASFVNRCNLRSYSVNGESGEMFIIKHLGYQHIFKSGGSTILQMLEKAVSKNWLEGGPFPNARKISITHTKRGERHRFFIDRNLPSEKTHKTNPYFSNLDHWYSMFRHIFYFTYIRMDPIERMLSGFYEMHIKGWDRLLNSIPSDIQKIDRFRYYYGRQLNRLRCVGYSRTMEEKKDVNVYSIWHELHTQPQMLHLLNFKLEYLPFDFVGNLSEIELTFPLILDEFSDQMHENPKLFGQNFRNGRDRNKGYVRKGRKYASIHRNELSDDDIRDLCELLWMDYICLPLDVPKQCNITLLFLQHYGNDVVYNDCYHVRR